MLDQQSNAQTMPRSAPIQMNSSQANSMANSPMPSPMSDSNLFPGSGGGHHDHGSHHQLGSDGEGEDEDDDELGQSHLSSSIRSANLASGSEGRRRQATAIILMGVIGFEYGSEITGEPTKQATPPRPAPPPRPPRPGEVASANGAIPNQLSIPQVCDFLLLVYFRLIYFFFNSRTASRTSQISN